MGHVGLVVTVVECELGAVVELVVLACVLVGLKHLAPSGLDLLIQVGIGIGMLGDLGQARIVELKEKQEFLTLLNLRARFHCTDPVRLLVRHPRQMTAEDTLDDYGSAPHPQELAPLDKHPDN